MGSSSRLCSLAWKSRYNDEFHSIEWIFFVIGLCEIEQTERGWYITLIDKDPDAVRREMDTERKEKMDLDDEQRRQKLIAEQVNRLIKKILFYFFIFR